MANIEIRNLSEHVRLGHYEPGNGTSYRVIAIRGNFGEQQSLGYVEGEGWVVVSCMGHRQAYLFRGMEGDYLSDDYIQEKLGGSAGDYPYFGDLVRAIIGRAG